MGHKMNQGRQKIETTYDPIQEKKGKKGKTNDRNKETKKEKDNKKKIEQIRNDTRQKKVKQNVMKKNK